MAIWYTVRLHQRVVAAPEIEWSNTLEVSTTTVIDNERAQTIMTACKEFLTNQQLNTVEMYDATCSSWVVEEGTQPPDELFTYEGDVAPGQRSAVAQPAPLEHTLHITKVPERGNKGKLFIRGALYGDDLTTSARRYVILPASRLAAQTRLDVEYSALVTGLANAGGALGMVSFPRIGWDYPGTVPGEKQVRVPIYATEKYERGVSAVKVRGSSYLQLEQH